MVEPQRLQKNAVNAAIIVTVIEDGVAVNLAATSSKRLVFKKPHGETAAKDASFFTDGTDGKLRYLTEPGFLDDVGLWKVQADLIFLGATGYDGPTEVGTFIVDMNALGNI